MLIPLNTLILKYNIPTRGIIHIGAHQAEEAEIYESNAYENVIWIEGNEELIPYLQKKLNQFTRQKAYLALIDIEEKEIVFNITNNAQSSSIYDLKEHLEQYSEIDVERQVVCKTCRLDNFLKKNNINITGYNFLNLDIQGNELNAIKSLGTDLQHFDYIYTEVQIAELYKNSHNIFDIDTYLFSKGFKRVETNLKYKSWGDAFYIRTKNCSKLNKYKNLISSLLLVKTWPIRKLTYLIFDKLYYGIKSRILKLFKK